MIGDALRGQIDAYAARMPQTNPLFFKAAEGSLTPACVARYLANVHYLVAQAGRHLDRARDRALAAGDEALASHFAHKKAEELGHDRWAASDLRRVCAQAEVEPSHSILPSMRNLDDFVLATIDRDPCLYLAYMLYMEYLIVVLGPEWLRLLEERCGIPRTSMTVIGNHVELDKDHVDEALARIDDLVGSPRKLASMRQTVADSIRLFHAFCVEVTADVPQMSAA